MATDTVAYPYKGIFFSRMKHLLAMPQHGNPEDHVLSKVVSDTKDYLPHDSMQRKVQKRDKEISDRLELRVRKEGGDCE